MSKNTGVFRVLVPYKKVDFVDFPCVKMHKRTGRSEIFFCMTGKSIYKSVKKLTFPVDFNEGLAVKMVLIQALIKRIQWNL